MDSFALNELRSITFLFCKLVFTYIVYGLFQMDIRNKFNTFGKRSLLFSHKVS